MTLVIRLGDSSSRERAGVEVNIKCEKQTGGRDSHWDFSKIIPGVASIRINHRPLLEAKGTND